MPIATLYCRGCPMPEHVKNRLIARYRDLMQRATVMRRCRFHASADHLQSQAWSIEATLNRAGVWL